MSAFPASVDAALLVAWLAILVAGVVRYRRGGLSYRKLLLVGGASCTWAAYSLLQLTEARLVTDPLEYVVEGAAVLLLVVGLYTLYRGWRLPEEPEATGEPG